MTNEPDPETGAGAQPTSQPNPTQGLVETGPVDISGVQDAGPADADEEAEGARPFARLSDGEA